MGRNQTEGEENGALAAYTDALLAGEAWEQDERPPLADTVELLARTLGPQPVPDTLRHRLKGTIREGFTQPRHPARDRLLNRQPLTLFRPPARRWAWGAIGALLVLAVVAALVLPTEGKTVVGTVTGEAGPVLLVVGATLAAVLGVAWLVGRRKK
jgi:hypothetical protein